MSASGRRSTEFSAATAESRAELALHAEPHDGNRLTVGGVVVYIDLEAVCIGPVEWDLAYFPDAVAEEVWPDHDRRCAEGSMSA